MDFLCSAFSQHALVFLSPKWQVLLGIFIKAFVVSFSCSFSCFLVPDHNLSVLVALCVPATPAFEASFLLLGFACFGLLGTIALLQAPAAWLLVSAPLHSTQDPGDLWIKRTVCSQVLEYKNLVLTPPMSQPWAASSFLCYFLLPWPLPALPLAPAVTCSPKSKAEGTVKLPGGHLQSCTALHQPSGEAWKGFVSCVLSFSINSSCQESKQDSCFAKQHWAGAGVKLPPLSKVVLGFTQL